jgi:hypothetical protein
MDQADAIRLQHMRDATPEALHFATGKTRTDLLDVVWDTTSHDLPQLLIDIDNILLTPQRTHL